MGQECGEQGLTTHIIRKEQKWRKKRGKNKIKIACNAQNNKAH